VDKIKQVKKNSEKLEGSLSKENVRGGKGKEKETKEKETKEKDREEDEGKENKEKDPEEEDEEEEGDDPFLALAMRRDSTENNVESSSEKTIPGQQQKKESTKTPKVTAKPKQEKEGEGEDEEDEEGNDPFLVLAMRG